MSLEGTLTVDTINEKTSTSGVTIDGVLLKDGGGTFTGDVSANDASFNVVDIHTLNLTTSFTKSDVGLENVDNTTDAGKPVSTAQQTALDLKANLAGPTFTGNVTMSDISANDASFNVVDIASLKVNAVQLPTKSEAGAPATTPTAGTMVFNTNDNKLYIYNGTAWRSVDTDAV